MSDTIAHDPAGHDGAPPMLADLTDARRLLCACNLAYGVSTTGRDPASLTVVPPVLSSADAIAAMQAAVALERGSFRTHQAPGLSGIDAFLYGETPDAAILAFRGTLPVRLLADLDRVEQTVGDWLNNARVRLVSGEPLGLPGHVHQGYAMSLETLWRGAGGLEGLLPMFRSAARQGKRLLVTGHSKGGALAQLAALRLAALGDPDLMPAAVHTFAAPRSGDPVFAQTFDRILAGRAWRFEYQDDLVPHLPPAAGLWSAIRLALQGGKAGRLHAELVTPASWNRLASTRVGRRPMGTYESAGHLLFIDWSGGLHARDTPELQAERLERLRHALTFSLPAVARAHLPMRGFGYMSFLERCAD